MCGAGCRLDKEGTTGPAVNITGVSWVCGAGCRLDKEGTTGPALNITAVSWVGLCITGMGELW